VLACAQAVSGDSLTTSAVSEESQACIHSFTEVFVCGVVVVVVVAGGPDDASQYKGCVSR